ncbi:hypothetical protein L1987_81714 [Smallanthus sonchifolius]|uniref:Uncharacterized protein n=1 Tax=Smallanthus sonchifolius TaxID=185202 RepID=A0ACB8YSB5_9ASTR|nr:hypothetical protein L1987_81714 [Smallanthus sonchifolius]
MSICCYSDEITVVGDDIVLGFEFCLSCFLAFLFLLLCTFSGGHLHTLNESDSKDDILLVCIHKKITT